MSRPRLSTRPRPRRVAVVGSGIAGLSAAHVLTRHGDHVTLFEADGRAGGHAHTHDVEDRGRQLAIDTGFIIHNRRTYPLVTRLFDELAVETQPSPMGFAVSCTGCGIEYGSGRGPLGVLARPGLVANRRYLGLLREFPRFYREAQRVLSTASEETLGGFARRHRLSAVFVDHFLAPFVGSVWSCPPGVALEYPARYLFRFLDNHHMLQLGRSWPWRTVVGGSREYVRRIVDTIPTLRLDTRVRRVAHLGDAVEITVAGAATQRFDGAVIATHADDAVRLLAEPTSLQRTILGSFRYSRNVATLHTDAARTLPRARLARGSWNHRFNCNEIRPDIEVTYDLTRLQRLVGSRRYLVTLNAAERIDPDHVLTTVSYDHPVYTPDSVAAQVQLPRLNDGTLAFAGAHHGWGFHEDGCRAGVAAAAALGARWS